jgi:transglutaminase-like putative cysteine protease
MILEIQHETRLEYAEPVTESVAEVRMEPVSDARQCCHSFHLNVTPATEIFRYQDGFANHVHHFNVLEPHARVTVLAASIIETLAAGVDLHGCEATYPLPPEDTPLESVDYLGFRGPVCQTPLLEPLLQQLQPRPGARLGDTVLAVSAFIKTHFTYAPAVTHASSPVDDVLRQGKGVCQDFAHLMIAVLRSFSIPARYVSGYLYRPGQESQSHAWCEVWLPRLGWVGMDPTHDRPINELNVKVAAGRDFTDVPPNKGVYRGVAQESIFVRVETRGLDRLPSHSWQEQLPARHAPLTAVPAIPRHASGDELSEQ